MPWAVAWGRCVILLTVMAAGVTIHSIVAPSTLNNSAFFNYNHTATTASNEATVLPAHNNVKGTAERGSLAVPIAQEAQSTTAMSSVEESTSHVRVQDEHKSTMITIDVKGVREAVDSTRRAVGATMQAN